MNSKILFGIIVLLLVAVGGLLVAVNNGQTPDRSPIRIGVSVPLSGEAGSYGEAGRAGLELARKEINDAGGVNGRMIELIYEDDKCSAAGVSAMQKLINVDNVVAVIGPICSAAAGPAIPIARDAGMPELLIGASAPGLAGGDDSIFSNYASDSLQGKFVAEYIYSTLGKRRVAVLYVQNDWGQGLQQVFGKRFTELGGTVVFNEGAAQTATDAKSLIAKIKSANPDVIYLPAYPAFAVIAVKQMKELGITTSVVGGDALEADEFLKSGIADGVTYITGAVENPEAFQARVKAVTPDAIINIITPVSYDALKILATVMGEKGTKAKDIIAGLKALEYRDGVSLPLISYDQNGDLKEATYEVKIVRDTTPQIITPKR